jgi:PAS domain S-box-containing protein
MSATLEKPLTGDDRIQRLYELCDEAEGPLDEVASTLAEMLTHGVVVIGNEGDILLVSSDAISLFGYTKEDLIGQKIEILLPEAKRIGHVALRNRYLDNASMRQMAICCDVTGRHKDGRLIPITIGLSPIGDGGALAVIRKRP